jgi:hypothetical protein
MTTPAQPKQGHAALVARLDRGLVPGDHCGFLLRPSVRAPSQNLFRIHDPDAVTDLICEQKFHYGVRPVDYNEGLRQHPTARGCHVFRYPPKPSLTIKRVVVPGDEVFIWKSHDRKLLRSSASPDYF